MLCLKYKVVIIKSNIHHSSLFDCLTPSSFSSSSSLLLRDLPAKLLHLIKVLHAVLLWARHVQLHLSESLVPVHLPVINGALPCFAGELRAHQVLELQLGEDLLQTVLVQLVKVLCSSLRHL